MTTVQRLRKFGRRILKVRSRPEAELRFERFNARKQPVDLTFTHRRRSRDAAARDGRDNRSAESVALCGVDEGATPLAVGV